MNQSSDTLERILHSARELFHSRSYTDVGVAEICETAGVKKGSFYHFFPSKRDLTITVLANEYTQMKDELLDNAFSPSIPPLERITHMVEGIYAFQEQLKEQNGRILGCPFGNLAVELSTQDEAIRKAIEKIFRKMESYLQTALEEAVNTGEIANINVQATAIAMLAYLEGALLIAKTENNLGLLRQLLPAINDIRIAT